MKLLTTLKTLTLVATSVLALSGCGDKDKLQNASLVPDDIKVGVVPGPYREILEKYLNPVVVKRGHHLTLVEFTDWVQPDSSLDAGDIDANLFQHQAYLDGIVANQGLKLKSVINFPTLGIFLFSDKYKDLQNIAKDSTVGIPNDAVNLARALRVARDLGLITLKADKNEQKAAIADIDSNPLNLNFVAMEAAQLPRSLDSIDLAFVPGNYAYAARLDFEHALGAENVLEPIKLVIAVQEHRVDGVGKFLKEAVEDPDFIKAVDSDPVFRNFAKPQWWPKAQ